ESEQGWRIPTLEELRTLVFCRSDDPSYWVGNNDRCYGTDISPTILENEFPQTPAKDFWTRTPNPDRGSGYVRTVRFINGTNSTSYYIIYQKYLRLVRDSETPANFSLSVIVHGNGSVSTDIPGAPVCEDECTFSVTEGTSISLTASDEGGSSFNSWSG